MRVITDSRQFGRVGRTGEILSGKRRCGSGVSDLLGNAVNREIEAPAVGDEVCPARRFAALERGAAHTAQREVEAP